MKQIEKENVCCHKFQTSGCSSEQRCLFSLSYRNLVYIRKLVVHHVEEHNGDDDDQPHEAEFVQAEEEALPIVRVVGFCRLFGGGAQHAVRLSLTTASVLLVGVLVRNGVTLFSENHIVWRPTVCGLVIFLRT